MATFSKLQIGLKYLAYLVQSKSRYRVHLPFVFHLVEKGLRDKRWFYALNDLKYYQDLLEVSKEKIPYSEMGAGSAYRGKNELKVKTFYRRTKRPFKYYRLLFNLSRHFQPRTLVELGTGLGLSTLPLAGASMLGHVHSIEGNEALSDYARSKIDELNYRNITFHKGAFSDQLPAVLKQTGKVDLAFLDGNHTYDATLQYFDLLAPSLHEQSLVIVDDIHWSAGMEAAWKKLKDKPDVSLSIDLFAMGLLFFDPGMEKQDFKLRY